MEKRSYVVITSIGTDRPGIVADISGWLLELGGNIEDSRMSLLGGEFATLILVSGPDDLLANIESTEGEFEARSGLHVHAKQVSATPSYSGEPMLRYELRTTSLDHPGIVHEVSELLRRHGISIVTANTGTSPAPFTGVPVFHFQMQVDIPNSVPIGKLRQELTELGDRDRIDFVLTAKDM
jgi:glycine cleavage system transcriptional repressor